MKSISDLRLDPSELGNSSKTACKMTRRISPAQRIAPQTDQSTSSDFQKLSVAGQVGGNM